RVTLVSERTTMATVSGMKGSNSASESRFSRTVTFSPGCCLKYSIPLGEIGSQINTFIKNYPGHTTGTPPSGGRILDINTLIKNYPGHNAAHLNLLISIFIVILILIVIVIF